MKTKTNPNIKVILLWVLLAIILVTSAAIIPIGGDFRNNFRLAGKALIIGKSPYLVDGFYSPPWLAVLFIPFALLPERLSWIIFYSLNLIIYTIALIRLGINKWELILIMISPYAFYSFCFGNIDSLVLLGATLSPFWGIWLLLCKPQLTIGLIAMWVYRSIRAGFKQVLKDYGLISLICMLIWVFKLYPQNTPIQKTWNIQAFPWGIIPGGLMFWIAIKNSDRNLALASSPFFSPYVAIQSWVVTLLPASKNIMLLLLGNAISWVLLWIFIKEIPYSFDTVLIIVWGFMILGYQYKKMAKYSDPKRNAVDYYKNQEDND